MTRNSWDRFEPFLVWGAVVLGLVSVTTYMVVGQEDPIIGLIASLSVKGAIPAMEIRGTEGASPSSGKTPGSLNTSKPLVGSSTATDSSIRCRTKRIENYDGCNNLIVSDCNGEEYTELVRCAGPDE